MLVSLRHKACGEEAFKIEQDALERRDAITASMVTMPDGTHPAPHTQPICGSCGKNVQFNFQCLERVED